MSEQISEEIFKKKKDFLKILCILTFIGSGLTAFSRLVTFLMIDYIRDFNFKEMFESFIEGANMDFFESMININRTFFLFDGILSLTSVYGAFLMLNLKKSGFHVYSISQIVALILPQIYLSGYPFPFFPLLLAGAFVFLYSTNLSIMK